MSKTPLVGTPVVKQPTITKATTTTDEATKSSKSTPKGVRSSNSTSTLSSAAKTEGSSSVVKKEESKESCSRVTAFFQKAKATLSSALDTALNTIKNFVAKVREFFFGKPKEVDNEEGFLNVLSDGFGDGIETLFVEDDHLKEVIGKSQSLVKAQERAAEAQKKKQELANLANKRVEELDSFGNGIESFGEGVETLFALPETDHMKIFSQAVDKNRSAENLERFKAHKLEEAKKEESSASGVLPVPGATLKEVVFGIGSDGSQARKLVKA